MHAVKSLLLVGIPMPDPLTPDEAPALQRRLAELLAASTGTSVDENLGRARYLIVTAVTDKQRFVYADAEDFV